MFGKNPKRGILSGKGAVLEVQNIFKTLQGEGPNVGIASIFLRLGGCNLACSFCDTEFENFNKLSLDEIIKEINILSFNSENQQIIKLIVITGGEPFRQPIEILCTELIKLGFTIQIETNGTLYRTLPKEVQIVCSPKVGAKGYMPIREDLLPSISAFKFLIDSHLPYYNKVSEVGQSKYNIPVFIQPMDQYDKALNAKNIKLTIELALEKGYRLSYQLHKILGIE